MGTFKVMTMGSDLTATKSCLFNFLTDLHGFVKPSANLYFVVDFVLHCVEKCLKLSFFPFTVELAIET